MRIGISQRVDVIAHHQERRDALDQAWYLLAETLGIQLVPIPNALSRPSQWAQSLALQGLILSGGNDLQSTDGRNVAPERDKSEAELVHWATEQVLPVLGVCRGFQHLLEIHGGKLSPIESHVACRHPLRIDISHPLFAGLHFENVNSFHNYGIHNSDLGDLKALAWSEEMVEAALSEDKLHLGIMWHPERDLLQHENIELVSRFLKLK